MKKTLITVLALLLGVSLFAQSAQERPRFPRFKVLAFYNPHVEEAHVQFAEEV